MKFKTFCAANSGDGFISFFDLISDEKKRRVYYIKGGPGCGKSTLMKEIANQASDAELIYCSGDPSSLDGVVLPKQNVAVIDATSPHSLEPQYPAVRGNIIDLGEGWNYKIMNGEKIISLCDQKSGVYRTCYSLLKSAKNIHSAFFAPLCEKTDIEKLKKVADRLLMQNALWEDHHRRPKIAKRFLSAITPDGTRTLTETINLLGKNIILLEDRWLIGSTFLNYIDHKLTEKGIDHLNSYHPLLGKTTLHHIIIPSANLSIVSKDGYFDSFFEENQIIKKINTLSFIEKEFLDSNKNKLAFSKKLQRELIRLATDKLNEAKTIHLQIEQEYAKGTDFSATKHLKNNIMSELFPKP